jgi:tetratricopeptide (TPR) repeat protein
MKPRAGCRRVVAGLTPILAAAPIFALVAGLACSRRAQEPASLRPISQPDLARASESVKAQLQDAYASLTLTTEDRDANTPPRSDAYGRLGMLLMAAAFLDEAEACFLNAESLAPGELRWPYYLGHLYKAKGETDKSAAAFERALEATPDDPTTLVWLGDAYLDQGRPDAAIRVLERALARQPQSAAALFRLARASLAKNESARAIGQLEQALALDRNAAPVIHYQLSVAYRQLGDLAQADRHVRQRGPGEVRPPDPLMQELESLLESAIAYEVRGARALDARDWPVAAADFRKGIALAPNEPSLHHKLGTALFLSGDARAAREEFEAALRLSPAFVKAHYSLGVLLGSSGHPDQAIAHLSAAVKQDPTYVDARLRLADMLRMNGQPAEAIAHYREAANLDARVIDAPLGTVMALVTLGRYAEARDRLRDGMQQYPDQPAFAHLLVRLLAAAPDDRVRDGPAAEALMRGLLAKEQRTGALAEMMAMTMAELGQFGEAATWQRDAVADAERAGKGERARSLAQTLSLYERRRPCRTPWRADDLPIGD